MTLAEAQAETFAATIARLCPEDEAQSDRLFSTSTFDPDEARALLESLDSLTDTLVTFLRQVPEAHARISEWEALGAPWVPALRGRLDVTAGLVRRLRDRGNECRERLRGYIGDPQ
jgi:hypothetical protein